MPPRLRPFQEKLEADCYAAWAADAINIMPVSATGSGKTVLFSKLLYDETGASAAIAHRRELVSQIAIALARNGVRHRVIGAKKGSPLTRIITTLQVAELGYSFVDPNAKTGVGGVDTIIRMKNEPWFDQVRLQVQDEGHHVLRNNKWGQVASMFRNARGLFPTATPVRADGKGLGRHADGLADVLVLAPSMRDIIRMGYLTDYRIFAPPADNFDRSKIEVSKATGELNHDQAVSAVRGSSVTGDIIAHYLRIAPGKLGVTFAVDVEAATKTAVEFRTAGVPAEVVTANTPDSLRASILRSFKRREILQLVNVDLFGEGFDLPAIEVVSFGRPTDSYSLYSQQFGRTLRLMIEEYLSNIWGTFSDEQRLGHIAASGKPVGIIIDHVGNVVRHGLPDSPREWSLDRREARRGKATDAIPLTICVQCFSPYERTKKRCPYCDFYSPPASRGGIEYVDGDLTELDSAFLAQLRGEIGRIDGDFKAPYGMPVEVQRAAWNKHVNRQQSQKTLRNAIAWFAGLESHFGYSESESYRRFWFKYGVDVAGAQCLGAREAEELRDKILNDLSKFNIDGTVDAEKYFENL